MGASLRYAKVVDHEEFLRTGAKIRPGLASVVELTAPAPATVKPFYVLRAWDDFDAFTETWRILDPHGRTMYGPVTREVTAEHGDLADEIEDLAVDFDDEGYQLVLDVDGGEIARANFAIHPPRAGTPAS